MSDSSSTPPTPPSPLRVIIIGTGFAGLGMAIALQRAGIYDYLILEKAHDVGGVWRDNSYPGAACDVPSHLYSFSFRPNPNWSRVFSPGPEIQQYLRECARESGLLPHIRFGTDMLAARWQAECRRWVIETNHGDFEAEVLITATGIEP